VDHLKPYKDVIFEVKGHCNAKCPYCTTGNGSLKPEKYPARFIEPDQFQKAVAALFDRGLITPKKSLFHLYSWGEPLLHPRLSEILRVLVNDGINFGLSTNASKHVHFENDVLANLEYLYFSMPGFSKPSYERISGLDFDQVVQNIKMFSKNIRGERARTKLYMRYHLYQFNIGEINIAAKFCTDNGIDFFPYIAYLNDFNLMRAYLDKTLSKDMLGAIAKDLFLYHVDEFIEKMPVNYTCGQHDVLTIDEDCNVLTCCFLPKNHPDYSLGNLHALSADEIFSRKRSQKICAECTRSGVAYWAFNHVTPEYVYDFISTGDAQRMKDRAERARLSKSGFYRLGNSLLWQIRYIRDFFR
jgi:MoaA/NifB/PqqE/SkfB family radical SAM enzyme